MSGKTCVSIASLVTLAGSALAAPIVDGAKGTDLYGSILWVQNQPTGFGNNVAGTGGVLGNPQDVRTGIELAIPMSVLGNPALTNIRLAGFINGTGHDFVANQVIGGLPANAPNPGEPRNINFANVAGNQYITLNPARVGGTINNPAPVPTMDGSASGSDTAYYGGAKFVQTVYTGFGNNNVDNGIVGGGSELDGVYAFVWNNNTESDTSDDVLYLVIAGNLQSNYNKLELFFDTEAGGQNQLLGNNAGIDFGGLNRMGENPSGAGNGVRFDAGFAPDHWVSVTTGQASAGPPATYTLYVNYATLVTGGGGPGYYCGRGTDASAPTPPPALPLNPGGAVSGGDSGAPAILCTINNANIAGVSGTPSGLVTPDRDVANGSEIDGIYGYAVDGGFLYLLITGNLENGGQHLDLFFDVNGNADGQNTLLGPDPISGGNVEIEYGGLNRMGNSANGSGDGLTFDTGFYADYWLTVTNFGYPVNVFANAAVLRLNGPDNVSGYPLDYGAYDGGVKSQHDPVTFSGPRRDVQDLTLASIYCNYGPGLTRAIAGNPNGVPTPGLIQVAIDNNNVAGVTASDAPNPSVAGAAAVTTGIEIAIRLDELGWDGVSPIRVAGFINSNDHATLSNQVLGGLPGFPAANLGEPRGVNFANIAGTQYVTIPVRCPDDLDDDGDITNGYNPDGGVDVNDLLAFLAGFEDGDLTVDLDDDGDATIGNPDGGVDVNDLLYFLARFENGC